MLASIELDIHHLSGTVTLKLLGVLAYFDFKGPCRLMIPLLRRSSVVSPTRLSLDELHQLTGDGQATIGQLIGVCASQCLQEKTAGLYII